MSPLAGQAARAGGRVLRRVAGVALLLLLLPSLAVCLLAWRLDRGPIELPFVAHRIEAAARERGIPVTVGRVHLAWAGFRAADAPLVLTATDARSVAADRAGAPLLALGRVEAGFALPPLLRGQLFPRALTVTGVRGQLARQVDGRITAGFPVESPSLTGAVGQARRGGPAAFGGAAPAWTGLGALHLHDVALDLYDAPVGVVWRVAGADLDATHDAAGFAGTGRLVAGAGDAQVTATVEARAADGGTQLAVALTPFRPAAIGALAAALAPLAMLDAPLRAASRIDLDSALRVRDVAFDVTVDAGTVHAGTGTAPLRALELQAEGTSRRAEASFSLRTAPGLDGPVSTFAGTLRAAPDDAAPVWRAKVSATVDHVAFADLPALWPAGTGGPGTRPWITRNIPAGDVTAGRLAVDIAVASDLSGVALTAIDGALDATNLEVHWLRPVPPIVHGSAHLTITDPDVIDVAVLGGTQSGGKQGGINYRNGRVHMTGIAGDDQFADIETDLAGPLADLIGVLNHPKVALLSKRPVPMRDPSGTVAAHVAIGHLPLRDDVQLDDLAIRTTAHVGDAHLGGTAAGRDIDHGNFDISADNDGLQLSGRAELAHIPSTLKVGMDFRTGPPDEVIQDVAVTGRIDSEVLARQGIDTGEAMRGSADLAVRLRSQRGGKGELVATAELTPAELTAPGLGYVKPAGAQATASVRVTLDHDRLASVDDIRIEGRDIDVRGHADVANGRPEVLRIERLHLGGTEAKGQVKLPRRPGEPYVVGMDGPSLDVSGPFQARMSGKPETPAPKKADATVPPFVIDARFDRVLLGDGRRIDGFSAHVDNDGRLMREARAGGTVRDGGKGAAPFRMAITPEPGGRRVTAAVPEAGAMLRTLRVADSIRGGNLALDARFDDRAPGHPLAGTLTMESFRVLDAPLMARILKAATLYGIVDLLRGPGVGFTRMVLPFRYVDDVLTMHDARVVSPSLGGTAEGTLSVAARTLDLRGTVVPLYALNTLPGRIPLVGRLFSPEKSGGLFAATYAVRGGFDDPDVSVDPATVLAPGMLRRLFELF